MKSNPRQLRPQDILVLLKILTRKEEGPWKFVPLARALKMSQSEIHQSVRRAELCDLYDPLTRKPKRAALVEFLIHGLRHVFPALPGKRARGVPTAQSAPPISRQIVSSPKEACVWPHLKGKTRGLAVRPLYPTVPEVALEDPEMHALLALIDALRIGKAREREFAREELSKRIMRA